MAPQLDAVQRILMRTLLQSKVNWVSLYLKWTSSLNLLIYMSAHYCTAELRHVLCIHETPKPPVRVTSRCTDYPETGPRREIALESPFLTGRYGLQVNIGTQREDPEKEENHHRQDADEVVEEHPSKADRSRVECIRQGRTT